MKNVLILLFLLISKQLLATHIRGGEITYTKIRSLTYEITLKGYATISSPVKFGSGVLDLGDGTTINPPQAPSYVLTDFVNVGIYIFKTTHTYPNEGFFKISYYEQNLDEGVVNLSNSVDTPLYIESGVFADAALKLPALNFGCDPVLDAVMGTQVTISNAVTDTSQYLYDYQLAVPQFVQGFRPPDSLIINSQTGLMSWNGRFQKNETPLGQYYFAVRVNQYDLASKLIGFVTRVFTIDLKEAQTSFSLTASTSNERTLNLPPNTFKSRIILSDSSSVDSLRFNIYFDSTLKDNISFIQYDSSAKNKKIRVGLFSFTSTEQIVRNIPFNIVLRGKSYLGGFAYAAKDFSYWIFTKDSNYPIITDVVSDEVAVFPNPCSNEIFVITKAQEFNTKLFDFNGNGVLTTESVNNNRINVSSLTPGMYILILNIEGKTTRYKVIKK
ncbi:MAG: T9SS type A sorting domain-containing protein [Cyclobacteriaceae bacterium]